MELKDKDKEFRKPTEQESKEYETVDTKLDKVIELDRSRVDLRKKTFMKISDVDPEDAAWFKNWCDKHTDKKQFLGIKVIRQILERIDPLITNILTQINDQGTRIDALEGLITSMTNPPEEKLVIPKTQGGNKKPMVEE